MTARAPHDRVTEAKCLIDSVTVQPPDFSHRRTRDELHAFVDRAAAIEAAAREVVRIVRPGSKLRDCRIALEGLQAALEHQAA